MKIITPLNPHSILVKFNTGSHEGRVQTQLSFKAPERYVDALRSALDAVSRGCTQVEVIKYRTVIHTHSQLAQALYLLSPDATDDEVVDQVGRASVPVVANWGSTGKYLPPWAYSMERKAA